MAMSARIPARDIVLGALSSAHPHELGYEDIRQQSAFGGGNEQLDCILRGLHRGGYIRSNKQKWRFVPRENLHGKQRTGLCEAPRLERLNVDFELGRLLDSIRGMIGASTKTGRGVLVSNVDWAFLETAVAYYEEHGYG